MHWERYTAYLQYIKPQPNDCNISTQHIATLLGVTCCVRLATLLRHVATCCEMLARIWNWSNFSRNSCGCFMILSSFGQVRPNLVPRVFHFPLTSGRKTRALGATILKWPNSGDSAHPVSLRSLHLWRMPEMVAPRALVFRPLVKGSEDSGNEIGFVQQCCARACALVRFSIPNMTQQGGQTHATCCTQQCCDMLRSNIAIVWPELSNAGPTTLGYVSVLKCCDRFAGALIWVYFLLIYIFTNLPRVHKLTTTHFLHI